MDSGIVRRVDCWRVVSCVCLSVVVCVDGDNVNPLHLMMEVERRLHPKRNIIVNAENELDVLFADMISSD